MRTPLHRRHLSCRNEIVGSQLWQVSSYPEVRGVFLRCLRFLGFVSEAFRIVRPTRRRSSIRMSLDDRLIGQWKKPAVAGLYYKGFKSPSLGERKMLCGGSFALADLFGIPVHRPVSQMRM